MLTAPKTPKQMQFCVRLTELRRGFGGKVVQERGQVERDDVVSQLVGEFAYVPRASPAKISAELAAMAKPLLLLPTRIPRRSTNEFVHRSRIADGLAGCVVLKGPVVSGRRRTVCDAPRTDAIDLLGREEGSYIHVVTALIADRTSSRSLGHRACGDRIRMKSKRR